MSLDLEATQYTPSIGRVEVRAPIEMLRFEVEDFELAGTGRIGVLLA